MNVGELLVAALAGTVEVVAETKLVEVLQSLHDKDKPKYLAAVHGLYAGCLALEPLVKESSNKIDDAVLNSLKEAVETSAKANGVELAS